ncbi:hypothetical protein GCM10010512_39110 [Streptomyces thermoviolaceus subsp. thermoviolaceus]|nr:hypothetical protein GCM10010512_39110 [Streptomyces thermoviolaceus subsp. thermoviolaceus]
MVLGGASRAAAAGRSVRSRRPVGPGHPACPAPAVGRSGMLGVPHSARVPRSDGPHCAPPRRAAASVRGRAGPPGARYDTGRAGNDPAGNDRDDQERKLAKRLLAQGLCGVGRIPSISSVTAMVSQ